MTELAAIRATFSDLRIVKGRKVAQLVMEIPIEQADHALAVLGGIPRSDKEVWVGIARLDPDKIAASREDGPPCPSGIGTPPESAESVAPAASKTRKPFHELRPSQQAGIRCNDSDFWQWLDTQLAARRIVHTAPAEVLTAPEQTAAHVVRQLCGVQSRAELDANPEAAAKWKRLNDQFETRNYDPR